MQRNRILGDILSTLFERPFTFAAREDRRDIKDLCNALMSAEGEVSGLRLAATILQQYRNLPDETKLEFFKFLNDEMEIDADRLAELAKQYADDPNPQNYADLVAASEPRRQELLRRLNQPAEATAAIVQMRVDLLALVKEHPELGRTDMDFVHLLRSWFNRGFLVLRQINWDTPARLLDKIVAYEAVHAINDWDDLRRRLYPPDRQCFAFFHPSMPDEPLIFVELALTDTLPGSIDAVLSDDREALDVEDAKIGVFYSISNCQKGLKGISFGNLLIKQVVTELSQDFPQVDMFVTLSPIPGMNRWLEKQTEDELAKSVLDGTAQPEDVRKAAAHYLVYAKRSDGFPVDPVARFHLGNGAEVHATHANADMTEKGLAQSSGAMVNYLYKLSQTERNHENFATRMEVVASRPVKNLADAANQTKRKEVSQ